MDDAELLQKMGWKTHNGRWWTDEFDPIQNTLTLEQALERAGIKPKK